MSCHLYSIFVSGDESRCAVCCHDQKNWIGGIFIEAKQLLRYSMQLGMLKQLLHKKLITEYEYEKVKKKLMKDYGVISQITT